MNLAIIARGQRQPTEPTAPRTRLVLVPCRTNGCTFTASGRREGDTLNSYSAHYRYMHVDGPEAA